MRQVNQTQKISRRELLLLQQEERKKSSEKKDAEATKQAVNAQQNTAKGLKAIGEVAGLVGGEYGAMIEAGADIGAGALNTSAAVTAAAGAPEGQKAAAWAAAGITAGTTAMSTLESSHSFTKEGRAKAVAAQARNVGEQVKIKENRLDHIKKNNPNIMGKDGTIDTSSQAGKKAYRLAHKIDSLKDRQNELTEKAKNILRKRKT